MLKNRSRFALNGLRLSQSGSDPLNSLLASIISQEAGEETAEQFKVASLSADQLLGRHR